MNSGSNLTIKEIAPLRGFSEPAHTGTRFVTTPTQATTSINCLGEAVFCIIIFIHLAQLQRFKALRLYWPYFEALAKYIYIYLYTFLVSYSPATKKNVSLVGKGCIIYM